MKDSGEKKSFRLYNDYEDIFIELTDEQAGKISKAIFAHINGNTYMLEGLLKAVFAPIRNQLDRDHESYTEKCITNQKNGALGGRPSKNQPDINETQNNQTVILENQNEPKKPYTDTDTGTNTDTEIDESCKTATDARARNIKHIISMYSEHIGEPDEQTSADLVALLDKYGFLRVWKATDRAGKRSPPPDNPIGYIVKLIDTDDDSGKTIMFGTFDARRETG